MSGACRALSQRARTARSGRARIACICALRGRGRASCTRARDTKMDGTMRQSRASVPRRRRPRAPTRARVRWPPPGLAAQMTLASFLSLSTRSSTLSTITPPARLGGSDTRTVSSCAAISTPRSAGESASIFFFFAFMMAGSLA